MSKVWCTKGFTSFIKSGYKFGNLVIKQRELHTYNGLFYSLLIILLFLKFSPFIKRHNELKYSYVSIRCDFVERETMFHLSHNSRQDINVLPQNSIQF